MEMSLVVVNPVKPKSKKVSHHEGRKRDTIPYILSDHRGLVVNEVFVQEVDKVIEDGTDGLLKLKSVYSCIWSQ